MMWTISGEVHDVANRASALPTLQTLVTGKIRSGCLKLQQSPRLVTVICAPFLSFSMQTSFSAFLAF